MRWSLLKAVLNLELKEPTSLLMYQREGFKKFLKRSEALGGECSEKNNIRYSFISYFCPRTF